VKKASTTRKLGTRKKRKKKEKKRKITQGRKSIFEPMRRKMRERKGPKPVLR